MLNSCLRAVTANSSLPLVNCLNPDTGKPDNASAMCKSVKPQPFQYRISSDWISDGVIPNSPAALISVSTAAIFSNRCRNQRVTPPVKSRTSSIEYPLLKASKRAPIRRSVGTLNQSTNIASGKGCDALSSIVSPPDASANVRGLGCG